MINFKHETDQDCFLYMSPKLGEVMIDMHQWFYKCGYDFVITSVIRPNDSISKSSTHQTGRAFDVRMKHIESKNFISDTVVHFNKKYSNIAAFSRSKNAPTLIIPHGKGDNFHLHVQLNYKYKSRYAQNFFKE